MTELIPPTLAILFGTPGWAEIVILALIGVLIFGKRLPEVGKSIGKGIVEFKKGLAGVEDDIDQAADPKRIDKQDTPTASASSERQTTSAPSSNA